MKTILFLSTVFIVLLLSAKKLFSMKTNENILDNITEYPNVFNQIPKEETFQYSSIDFLYQKWSLITGVDWKLLKAISIVESGETPEAIGDNGNSFGIMQVQNLIGKYYAGYEGTELLNPDHCIEAGSKFLADLLTKYSRDNAIQAYNLGETKFNQGYRSTDYLNKVLKNYV